MTSSRAEAPAPTGGWGIADIERDTGLSKDTLRVWERRYGFPQPARNALGERSYPADQVQRLRHVKRLLDAGFRAGQVVGLAMDELQRIGPQAGAAADDHVRQWMDLIRAQDGAALRRAMTERLARHGLVDLVAERLPAMNTAIGQAWLAGELAVFEEHLYSECVQTVLRCAITDAQARRAARAPRVLLTTLPGEPHGLGLLMVECLLALEGCETVALGTQLPLEDIVRAQAVRGADIVALSFTASPRQREVQQALHQLRQALPQDVALWAGGQCPALRRALPEGITVLCDVLAIPAGVRQWREVHASP